MESLSKEQKTKSEQSVQKGESVLSEMSSRISGTISEATDKMKHAFGMESESSVPEKMKEKTSDIAEKVKGSMPDVSQRASEGKEKTAEKASQSEEYLKERTEQLKQAGGEKMSGVEEEAKKGRE